MERTSIARSIRRFWASFFIVLLSCWYSWGLDPQKPVGLYLVDKWDKIDGLPSNSVRSITQTPDGYLWIGTTRGVVRFDGMKFVPLSFGETDEVYSREIRHLLVDSQGGLWIGSSLDLTLYCRQGNLFKRFTRADGITEDGIRRIIEDMKGNIWVSFETSYVNRFSDGKFEAFNASHGLLGKKVNVMFEDRQGNLLFGTRENGVFIYKDGTFSKYPVPVPDNVLIVTMYEDRKGNLWICTDIGLYRVNGKETERYTTGDGLSNNHITGIIEDSEGNLWVGTHAGLNRMVEKQTGTVGFENLLTPFEINCIYEDREKSLWIGTGDSGINRLKDPKFMSYGPLDAYPGESPFSMFEDRRGNTWIGTTGGKIFRGRGGKLSESEEIPGISGKGIAAIAEDGDGNLWLGTTGMGVFQKKNGTFVQFTRRDGLTDSVVTSITRDSRNNLWFGTFDGVSVRRSGDGVIVTLTSGQGLSGKRVHNVYETKTGDILIAADRGITILEKSNLLPAPRNKRAPAPRGPWSPKAILQGVSVTCIYEDPSGPGTESENGIYWIATEGAGLKRVCLTDSTVTSITSYTTAEGMTTNVIYQFLEDRMGNFWLMSDSGILRVSKSELESFANGGMDKINCTSFGISDGLKSLEFANKFSVNSALDTGSGEFMFITNKGISIVNPVKIRINKTPPQVVIETVSFNRRSVSLYPGMGPLTLKGIDHITFHFTALTFLSPGKATFKYRLEGAGVEGWGWNFTLPDQARTAYYKDLSPGTYTFTVIASNAEGVWNQSGDSVTVTLEPFLHQTLLFKIAVLLFFIAFGAVVFYMYKKKRLFFGKKAKYKGTSMEPHFARECITRLKYLVEIEKVYSDPDITLNVLAEKMSIAPYQLSQLLNEKLDRHFADFINSHRIEEVKRILQSPRGARRKISSIAGEVGFNTMAAFYKAFKKFTGMTPTQYKSPRGTP